MIDGWVIGSTNRMDILGRTGVAFPSHSERHGSQPGQEGQRNGIDLTYAEYQCSVRFVENRTRARAIAPSRRAGSDLPARECGLV